MELDPADVPLLGVVSRLAHQKGIDLILPLVDALVSLPAQLAVLGTGDASDRDGAARRERAVSGPRRVQPQAATNRLRT